VARTRIFQSKNKNATLTFTAIFRKSVSSCFGSSQNAASNHNPNDFINIASAFYTSLNLAFTLIDLGPFWSRSELVARNSCETYGVLREL